MSKSMTNLNSIVVIDESSPTAASPTSAHSGSITTSRNNNSTTTNNGNHGNHNNSSSSNHSHHYYKTNGHVTTNNKNDTSSSSNSNNITSITTNGNSSSMNGGDNSSTANKGGQQQQSATTAPELDCFGDDRDALSDFERFFNNSLCSDVSLLVGDEVHLLRQRFYAHKLVLVKHSEVFERMLSQQWSGDKREIELIEDKVCAKVFPAFLRFLYCNHILCTQDTALPMLILADKYNVPSLRKVSIEYAITYIIPHLSLKDIFHVWFQYGTKCFHQQIISHCIIILSAHFQDLISSPEWEKEWLSLEREQLTEFLKSSEICVSSEFDLWLAVVRWFQSPSHPERRGGASEKNLTHLMPLIRFPLMTADELFQVEHNSVAEQFPKLFASQLLLAYKYQALPLTSRSGCREFSSSQFLLRNYTEIRWDKRICIADIKGIPKYTEVSEKVTTKASAIPPQTWDWELKIHPKGFNGNGEEFRTILVSNAILDQIRAVEYLLSIVDDKKILRSVSGKKTFSKTRYSADLEMEKKVSAEEISEENSSLLIDNNLCVQLTLRPID